MCVCVVCVCVLVPGGVCVCVCVCLCVCVCVCDKICLREVALDSLCITCLTEGYLRFLGKAVWEGGGAPRPLDPLRFSVHGKQSANQDLLDRHTSAKRPFIMESIYNTCGVEVPVGTTWFRITWGGAAFGQRGRALSTCTFVVRCFHIGVAQSSF